MSTSPPRMPEIVRDCPRLSENGGDGREQAEITGDVRRFRAPLHAHQALHL
eukprot:CAMPEP_0185436624 /NCGR_PEP_ID=MMETSP1365-20130426/28523_1 /TAXON_ID=38817 /ORGANISM="Gephyrocapsa oceanica, Strain RCC1303" /LENGTH=50 /DNA_ID=CAMNT_0028041477 /DNA_START=22 /DNA_END=174 /DNA_ORIENTATION=+